MYICTVTNLALNVNENHAVLYMGALVESPIKCEIRVTRSFGISTDGSESIIQYKNANV